MLDFVGTSQNDGVGGAISDNRDAANAEMERQEGQ